MAAAAGGDLTDEERRALRGSKFAPLPAPPPSSRPNPSPADLNRRIAVSNVDLESFLDAVNTLLFSRCVYCSVPAHEPQMAKCVGMAHPGGPLTTNKAAALAKFLERKLQQPDGLESLNPDLVNLAVKNAKETIKASKGETSTSGRVVRHVPSFEDSSEASCQDDREQKKEKKKKKKKKTKTKTKTKAAKDLKPHNTTKKRKISL